MQRREVLQSLGALMLGGPTLLAAPTSGQRRPRILFFSRSVLFEHSVVRREGQSLSLAEKLFSEWAGRAGLDVECTKDGTVFDGDLDQYAAVVSYTCGRPADLMKPEGKDGSPPLSERGWKKLDAAIRGGKPFVAVHPGAGCCPRPSGPIAWATALAGRGFKWPRRGFLVWAGNRSPCWKSGSRWSALPEIT